MFPYGSFRLWEVFPHGDLTVCKSVGVNEVWFFKERLQEIGTLNCASMEPTYIFLPLKKICKVFKDQTIIIK